MLFAVGKSCELCGSEDCELVSCNMCNSKICNNCFSEEEGICLTCSEAKCDICGEYLSARACNQCGRLVCEDHGLKKDEATICDICRMVKG